MLTFTNMPSFLLALLLSSSSSSITNVAAAADDKDDGACRLYMARSSIFTPHRPKFGLYAGVNFQKDDVLPFTELGIPLADFFEAPNRNRGQYEKDIVEYVQNFVWSSEYFGARWEGNYSSSMFVGGLGILANYHSSYSNIKYDQGASILRGRGEIVSHPGKPHPSRGSLTTYHNVSWTATEDIPTGMELFMDHGETWDGNYENDYYQDKYFRWDYKDADKVVDQIVEYMKKHGDKMDASLQQDILDFMLDKVLGTALDRRAKVIRSLIPDNPNKLKDVVEAGGTFPYRYREIKRDIKWLERNGFCVDQLRPGMSTIPNAGRGAFASRDIQNGDVITPVPMIPVGSAAMFDQYEIYSTFDDNGRSTGVHYNYDKFLGKQLMYNYAFGHPESNMFLLPVGPMMTLVNHGSLSTTANAYLTWSKAEDTIYNDHALHDLSTVDAMNHEYPIVTMELYAIRDIKEGEEILIDYGPQWEAAWQQHLDNFHQAHPNADSSETWPLKGEDMREVFRDRPYPIGDPYPDGVTTSCIAMTGEAVDGMPRQSPEGWDILPWTGPTKYEDIEGQYQTMCEIVAVDNVNATNPDGPPLEGTDMLYSVKMHVSGHSGHVLVHGVPHHAIVPVNSPYQSDAHTQPYNKVPPFRHFISIEDQRFPQMWRDLREIPR